MRSLTMLVLMAGVAWADQPPADATGSATDIVKAAIKATGGEEKLSKYLGGSMKMKGDMTVQGLNADFEGTVNYFAPDKFRMKLDVGVAGMKITIEQVVNGQKMKMTMNGNAIPIEDNAKTQLEESMQDQEIGLLVPLLDGKKYKLKAADDVNVDGKKAHQIIVIPQKEGKQKEVKIFFDKETHLLVKMQRKTTDETGAEVEEETFFQDYQKVQDIMTSMKGVVKHDGKEYMKYTLSDVKHLDKVDDKEFAVDD